MKKDYTYSAFISYSSKDEKIAKALWKKLERYRLPAVLQKQYEDIPEKMHVFLDQGDIVPGDTVENALSRELADSKKLIVICSPNSAKSPYVDLEVRNFLALGHSANDIIPYIIEGDVNRESQNNCYVPSLFGKTDKETINGVSLVRDGKWKAFVGILANLLDVKFDEIYKREKIRKNRIITAMVGLGILAACFMVLVIWYVMPHTKYYADYVTRWGIPEGIHELNKQERKKYPLHYKITFRALRPIKLEHVNIKDVPVEENYYEEHQNRPRVAEYKYLYPLAITRNKKNWGLSEARFFYDSNLPEANLNPVYSMRLVYSGIDSNECFIDFYYDTEDKTQKNIYNNFLSTQNIYFSDIPQLSSTEYEDNKSPDYIFFKQTSSIYRFKITYDNKGFEKKISFFNKNNHSVHESNGITGYILKHDEKGRIIEERYLYDENNFYGFKKINTKRISYDENDRISEIGFYYINTQFENTNKNKKLIQRNEILTNNSDRNYALAKIQWVEDDLEIKQIVSYYDEKGEKIKSFDNEIENHFNKNGIKNCCIKKSSENTVTEDFQKFNNFGLPVESIKRIEKDDGEVINESFNYSYLDINGFLIQSYIKTAGTSYLKIELSFQKDKGISKLIRRYELEDNTTIIEYQVYDFYGRYIENTITSPYYDNTFSVKIIYKGDNTSVCYYQNEDYCLAPDDTYVRADFAYNNDGMLIYSSFKDKDVNLINCERLGFAKYNATYSPNALLLLEDFSDSNGYLTIPKNDSYARYTAKNDIDDKLLLEGSWIDAYGAFANQNYNHFDSEKTTDGNYILHYYDSKNFIKKELHYKDYVIDKIISCWEEDNTYHKATYNYEGIALNVYNKDKDKEVYWNYSDGMLIHWLAKYNDGTKEEFYYDEEEYPFHHIKYSSEDIKLEESFAEHENGVLVHFKSNYYDDTSIEEFYENGKCIHLIKMLNNVTKIEEWFAEYKEDKMSHFVQELSDGQKNEEFYEDGECIHLISFSKDGSKEREWFKEFQDGQLIYDLDYTSDGRKAERWYENEKLVHRIVWDKSGNKEHEYFWNYKNNKLSYFKGLDLDGTILEEDYKDGKFYHSIKTYKDGRKEENYY